MHILAIDNISLCRAFAEAAGSLQFFGGALVLCLMVWVGGARSFTAEHRWRGRQ